MRPRLTRRGVDRTSGDALASSLVAAATAKAVFAGAVGAATGAIPRAPLSGGAVKLRNAGISAPRSRRRNSKRSSHAR